MQSSTRLSAIALALGMIVGLILLVPEPALASSPTPAATSVPAITPTVAIERLFTAPTVQSDWFDASFLEHFPLAQVQGLIASLQGELGHFQRVQPRAQTFLAIFDRGSVLIEIALNAEGQITGLRFKRYFGSLTEATQSFQALPGSTSVLVTSGQTEQAALNADQPLAVASTFKLAVLRALRSTIASGQRSWQDRVTLEAADKSLPSGILQDWPNGSILTVQTLATLMISMSDNTATDRLIHLIGRAPIEALAPRNQPFLTTRELFTLKSLKNRQWLQRYRTGNSSQRRSLLRDLAQLPRPTIPEFESSSPVPDVEWFFTARELCTLMAQVQDLPLMTINPGVATPDQWQRVAYKGGSEPGVINMTTWLTAKDGKHYCVTATWNHMAVDENQFFTLFDGLLGALQAPN